MTHDASHDFDFIFGHWKVRHRYLRQRLAGCTEWLEFDGTFVAQPILGGHGNIDDNVLMKPGGTYRAATFRSFDPKTQTWAIWFLDGRAPHTLDVPMIGRFDGPVGTFLCEDMLDGRKIHVRFVWTDLKDGKARWEQAFREDGSEVWETNWVMEYVKER